MILVTIKIEFGLLFCLFLQLRIAFEQRFMHTGTLEFDSICFLKCTWIPRIALTIPWEGYGLLFRRCTDFFAALFGVIERLRLGFALRFADLRPPISSSAGKDFTASRASSDQSCKGFSSTPTRNMRRSRSKLRSPSSSAFAPLLDAPIDFPAAAWTIPCIIRSPREGGTFRRKSRTISYEPPPADG